MAQVPDVNVPEVSPSARPPDDYQHVQATPAQSGALIGQGLQQLGQGATKAANFFGEVAADSASNDYQARVDTILHGDPNKMVQGPDGQMHPDTGYLGLKGRAALDARPQVQQQFDAAMKEIRGGLSTPDQQLRFDNFSRRYRSYAVGQVGSHADNQANAWYQTVNSNSSVLAMTHIANNADSPEAVAAGTADLINARVKQAEIAGAVKGDPVWTQAVSGAKRDALSSQLEAIAVNDPARAMSILQKNKDVAGLKYDELANKFRARADLQTGITAGTAAIKKTYESVPGAATVQPVLDNIGQQYGVSGSYLLRTHQLEGNGVSSTGASGPFQFTQGTAAKYGLNDRFDFNQSAAAAARLAADNRAAMMPQLGRPPSDPELYLAHQQGAAGAVALLQNPTLPAATALAPAYGGDREKAARAIAVNGGDPNAPASDFTRLWTAKYNGAAGAASMARKASAYQDVASNPDLSDAARSHAFQYINQTIASQQIAEESNIRAKKLASDTAAQGYVTSILNGQSVNLDQISSDQSLDWETKIRLRQLAESYAGEDQQSAERHYGPGFWNAYKSISAPADDPGRISDYSQLLALGGPGVDPTKKITLSGLQKLNEIMTSNRKSVNDQAVNTTKLSLMNYAKGRLSFEQDTGPIKLRDPEGERLFNAQFVPKFEAAYEKWVKGGKDPWEFLQQKNVDEMIKGMRPASKMAQDKLAALGAADADKNAPLPPPPDGVNAQEWTALMAHPPRLQSGANWPASNWAAAINDMSKNPTPDRKAAFDKYFSATGLTADGILHRLSGTASAAPIAPAVETKEEEPNLRARAHEVGAAAHEAVQNIKNLGISVPGSIDELKNRLFPASQ